MRKSNWSINSVSSYKNNGQKNTVLEVLLKMIEKFYTRHIQLISTCHFGFSAQDVSALSSRQDIIFC